MTRQSWNGERTKVLTVERLRQIMDYDRETGVFTWRARPVTSKYEKIWNTRYAGTAAGTVDAIGRIVISVDGRLYKAHRLAWLYVTGAWPDRTVDHKDINPANNRWDNLRLATKAQQNMNQHLRKDNVSGVRGVSYDSARDKHLVQIYAGGKLVFVKKFDSFDEAVEAANAARAEAHGEFAHVGKLNWNAPQAKEAVIDPWQ